jgi:hypothetical protein
VTLFGRATIGAAERTAPVPPLTAVILIRLVVESGQTVRIDELHRDVWGYARAELSPSERNNIQKRISALRDALDLDGEPTTIPLIYGQVSGYQIVLDRIWVDVVEFADLINSIDMQQPDDAIERYRRALALWRDRPLLDAANRDFAQATIGRLYQQRESAELGLAELYEQTGQIDLAVPLVERLRARNPLDDRIGELAHRLRGRTAPTRSAGQPAPQTGPAPRTDRCGEMADALARTVAGQMARDGAGYQLRGSPRLPVSWRAAAPALADRNLDGVAGQASLRTTLAAAGGRLVLLGPPGAGKTVLLMGLVEELLATRDSGGLLPVLLALTSWNAARQEFRPWLRQQLIQLHSGLRTQVPDNVGAGTWADVLIEDRLILPVLDGLDEMRPEWRQLAIQKIGVELSPATGVVLACRTRDYQVAVRPGRDHPVRLIGAAVVELSDVDTKVVAEYLRADDEAERWEAVLEVLGTNEPVGRALRTVLPVNLMRAGFGPASSRDPAELCDRSVYPTEPTVRRALVEQAITSAYRRPSAEPTYRDRPESARRALAFLARHLHSQQTTELAWWRLRDAVPSTLPGAVVAVACGLVVALLVTFAAPITAWLGGEPHKSIGVGVGLGILVALAVSHPRARPEGHSAAYGLAAGLTGALIGGFAAGAANLVGVGKADWPTGGLGAALAVGATIGPVSRIRGGLAGGMLGGLVSGLLSSVGAGVLAGLVDALGVGLAAGVTVGFVGQREPTVKPHWDRSGYIGGAAVAVAIGLATGLVSGWGLGLAAALAIGGGIAWVTGLSVDGDVPAEEQPPSPSASLRRDAAAFLRYWAAGSVSAGLIALLADGLDAIRARDVAHQFTSLVANGLVLGILAGTVSGIVLGGLHSAWLVYRISHAWLWLRGQLPRRFGAFLADAHARQILRQLGPVYQFRHLEFQDHLAESTAIRQDAGR